MAVAVVVASRVRYYLFFGITCARACVRSSGSVFFLRSISHESTRERVPNPSRSLEFKFLDRAVWIDRSIALSVVLYIFYIMSHDASSSSSIMANNNNDNFNTITIDKNTNNNTSSQSASLTVAPSILFVDPPPSLSAVSYGTANQQQHYQQDAKPDTSTLPLSAAATPTPSPPQYNSRHRERQRFLLEATRVLEHCDGLSSSAAVSLSSSAPNSQPQQQQQSSSSHFLDGFHLLGVLADPRGPVSQFVAAAAASSSVHHPSSGRYGTTEDGSAAAAAASSSSFFGNLSSYPSIESTYFTSMMTGQMEAFNHVLEDWSRQLLSDDAGDTAASGGGSSSLFPETFIPESQLQELPPEIESPNVALIAEYLTRSGPKAAAFARRLPTTTRTATRLEDNRSVTRDDNDNTYNANQESATVSADDDGRVDVSDIPSQFFAADFDLTDPTTFRNLLLRVVEDDDDADNDDGEEDGTATTTNNSNKETSSLLEAERIIDESVLNLLPLLPQDALSGHLDKVELALLQQVRSNSDRFFSESQRFAQLQEWILSLLGQVAELQTTTERLQCDILQPMETVPTADVQRTDLRKLEVVLERAEDMLLCKHSLGGVLSAQDDLTAIEQIQYGRKLLNGTWVDRREENSDRRFVVELGRLHSFKAATEQLNQYEQLVVSNLRDEMIEVCLSWNSTPTSGHSDASMCGNGSSPSKFSASMSQHEQQSYTRLREITGALQTCKALTKTREAYAVRLQDMIRMTVRTTVGEFASDCTPAGAVQSVAMSASSMSLIRFLDCLDMLFEQLLALLTSAANVDYYFVAAGLKFQDVDEDDAIENAIIGDELSSTSAEATSPTPLSAVIASGCELSSKSTSELLRLRKDAHSLVTLGEMKSIWEACMSFTLQLEKLSGNGHTSTLRTTLLAQTKSFLERKHESNMSALAAALDSERWVQCDVTSGRQANLSRLCSGLSVNSSPSKQPNGGDRSDSIDAQMKNPELEAEGTKYKVVWSCLLLVEMILNNISTAAHFPNLASSIVGKVVELLRLFNSRTTQLVLGAGAIHSHAKLKSINAKHLSLVTQCLGMFMAILPHVRAGLMAQLPKKQHTLLNSLDQIRIEYREHNEQVLNKFVTIIGGIVEHGLAKTIRGTDFDARAATPETENGTVSCCVFLEGVATNTRKMHQVLSSLLPPDHLIDTFSRIFAFLDNKIPSLFIAAANIQPVFQKAGMASPKTTPTKGLPSFTFPLTEAGKRQFLLEIESTTKSLNSLEGVRAWEFAAVDVMERELDFSLRKGQKDLDDDRVTKGEAAADTETLSNNDEAKAPIVDDDNENGSLQNDDGGSPSLTVPEYVDIDPRESEGSSSQPIKASSDDEVRLDKEEEGADVASTDEINPQMPPGEATVVKDIAT